MKRHCRYLSNTCRASFANSLQLLPYSDTALSPPSAHSAFGAEKKESAKSTVSHIPTANSTPYSGRTVEVSGPHFNFCDFIASDLQIVELFRIRGIHNDRICISQVLWSRAGLQGCPGCSGWN